MGQQTVKLLDLGATALGGSMEGFGSIVEGFGASQQATFQASVLKNNALIANEAAEAALRTGAIQVQEKQIEGAQTIGTQRATLAGRGIVVDKNTADILAADVRRITKLDEITIMDNARRQALAYKLQGYNFLTEAKAVKQEGKAAFMSGLTGGVGTLLATGLKVHQKWKSFNPNSTAPLGSTNDPYRSADVGS